jgi:hypothetical protein
MPQAAFGKLLGRLQHAAYSVLDIRAAGWYDDFGAFRAGVRALEVRLANVAQLAFDGAGSLAARLELLEARPPHAPAGAATGYPRLSTPYRVII